MTLFDQIRRWFRLILDKKRHYVAVRVEDAPDNAEQDMMYLIGDSPEPWAAAFLCPCGCGETISLSLIRTDNPSWSVTVLKDGGVTVYPSVWRTKGCKSHFFVRNGRVLWAKDEVIPTRKTRRSY